MENTDVEDSLQRLDTLTQEEARMASAELLKVAHSVSGQVMVVDDRVKDVEERVGDVSGDVREVGKRVGDVDDRVQGVSSNVQDITDRMQGVQGNLDQANRLSSPCRILHSEDSDISSQGTNSEIVFYSGFRLLIHPPIIILHAKLTTAIQLNGSFKAVYSANGSPLLPSCGYMENVCS